jgi:hypothetical protein
MKSELRRILASDIENYRKKADYYKSQHLFEAAHFANKLAENLELALTTLPNGDNPKTP